MTQLRLHTLYQGLTQHPRRACGVGLALIVLTGVLLRLPWLGTPGYNGMGVWKAWAYGTCRLGIAQVYTLGPAPEPPLSLRTLQQAATGGLPVAKLGTPTQAFDPDYPPGMFYLLGLLARGYETWVSPSFADGPALNALIKVPLALAELLTALLLGAAVGRRNGWRWGLGVTASYWLNPAVLLGGTILAFLDALYGVALVAGVILLLQGRPRGLWLGWAVALLLKPQPLLLLPVVLALGWRGRPGRLLRDTAPVGGLWLVAVLPMLLAGHPLGLVAGLLGNAHEGLISAYQFNLWWVWSYLYALAHGTHQTRILHQAALNGEGLRALQFWGLAFFGLFSACLVGAWRWYQRRFQAALAPGPAAVLLLALQFYGGTMLLTSMHENHLLGALPLLALAAGWAGGRGQGRGYSLWLLYGAVSGIAGANLLMVFGLGVGQPHPLLQMWGGLDGSVVITGVNIGVFGLYSVWWGRHCLASRPLAAGRGQRRAPLPDGITRMTYG